MQHQPEWFAQTKGGYETENKLKRGQWWPIDKTGQDSIDESAILMGN